MNDLYSRGMSDIHPEAQHPGDALHTREGLSGFEWHNRARKQPLKFWCAGGVHY